MNPGVNLPGNRHHLRLANRRQRHQLRLDQLPCLPER